MNEEYMDWDNFSQNIYYNYCDECDDKECKLKYDIKIAGCWIKQQVGRIMKTDIDDNENFSPEFCKTNK